MKNLCLFLFIFLFSHQVFSQITFEKTFGTYDDDEGEAIAVCQDGTYILAGNVTNIYTGDNNVFLVRINLYGDTIWTRTYGIDYQDFYTYDMIQTFDQGFIITGYTYVADTSMPFLLKYSEEGQFLWIKKYGSQLPDGYAYAVVQKPDSGFMICGREDFYNSDWYHRPFLLETDQNGVCTWSGIYTVEDYAYYDVYNLCLSSEYEYVMCGYFEQPIVSTIEHAWLFKVDSGMNINWSRVYGPSGYTSGLSDVLLNDDGGYMLCGSTYQGEIPLPGTNYDIYLIKTDSAGIAQWTKSIGYPDKAEYGRCMDITSDGGYIIGGQTASLSGQKDIWLVRAEENGDTIWTRKFGGIYNESVRDICVTPDGGYLLCGATDSYSIGGSDIYLVKTDENGLMTNINDNDELMAGVTVLPNPGNGIFWIRNHPENTFYSIYDIHGKMIIRNKKADELEEKVDISSCSSGMYLLNISSASSSRSFKLIVNH